MRRARHQPGGSVLPAAYAADHLDLGYAITGYRAQGVTVDTGHVLVTGQTSRETLYVAMTRGRHANTAYIGLDCDTDQLCPNQPADARVVLTQVLQTSGAELSAPQAEQHEHARWNTIPQWTAEYKTLQHEGSAGEGE